MFTEADKWALTLSTFAGLSTTIGGLLAIIKRPNDPLLAFLLGTAFGVMFVLSLAEMWLHNAMEHGWPNVTIAVLCGALLYQVAQPFLPDFKYEDVAQNGVHSEQRDAAGGTEEDEKSTAATAALLERTASGQIAHKERKANNAAAGAAQRKGDADAAGKEAMMNLKTAKTAKIRSAELLRLGLLMAFTMTLHNLPEGFAVAFSAFTDFGPIMAAAIAMHNIPEGIIVAAPVYAATGSRFKALFVATASGLSEPLGALIALVAAKPVLSPEGLHYILAFVGGIMAAVCVLELWPEGKKCRSDQQMLAGIALGGVLMGWTLWVGV